MRSSSHATDSMPEHPRSIPGGMLPWIVLATALAYGPSLKLGLWREDWLWVFGSFSFPEILWDWANPDTLGRYRPVTKLLMALVGSAGLDAIPWVRLTSVVLVGASGLAIAGLVRQATADRWAALLAALLYISSHRMIIVATWVTLWGAQLMVIFGCLALIAYLRVRDDGRPGAAAWALLWVALAIGCFEPAVNVPIAMLGLLAVAGRSRSALPSAALAFACTAIVSLVTLLHLGAPDAPGSHSPDLGSVFDNLRFVADHESGVLATALVAAVLLVSRARRGALDLAVVLLAGLFPAIVFRRVPDSYMLVTSYVGGVGLIGLVLALVLRRLGALERMPVVALLVLLSLGAGLYGRQGLVGLISRELEMRDSSVFVQGLRDTNCLQSREGWIAPLGLDPMDRRAALVTPPGEKTPLSEVCDAPIWFEEDPVALAASPRCAENGYFLTRDGAVLACPALAADPVLLARSIACGVPPEAPGLLLPAGGSWSGPELLCYSLVRGEGVDPDHPAVVVLEHQIQIRGTASVTLLVPDRARRLELQVEASAPCTVSFFRNGTLVDSLSFTEFAEESLEFDLTGPDPVRTVSLMIRAQDPDAETFVRGLRAAGVY